MHPKVAEAVHQIDAAVFNGDTFENPDDRKELLEYLDRWCKQLAHPYHGTKPPVFEEEWAKKEADGYQYGRDALENVKFGFEIAQEAYERGYAREVEASASVITIALEIVAARTGLGAAIWLAWQTLRIEELFAALVIASLIGVSFNAALVRLEKRLVPWHSTPEI